jgi:FkbM family methyltransferase
MLKSIKRLVRRSPLGPVTQRIHRVFFPERKKRSNPRGVKYDQQTIEVMRRVLRPESSCIDVGAHRGKILQEIVRISPLGNHFAFEPLPHFAAILRARFPDVRVYEAAVSDHTGTATFVHVENAPGYSGLRQRIYDRPDPVLKSIRVNVVRLDDVIPCEQSLAFIKLDIEGGEFDALRGATRTIRRCQPVVVFEAGAKSTVQYGIGPEDVYRLISEQLGYSLSTLARWLAGQSPYSHAEFCHNWHSGPDFFFIAYSTGTSQSRISATVNARSRATWTTSGFKRVFTTQRLWPL